MEHTRKMSNRDPRHRGTFWNPRGHTSSSRGRGGRGHAHDEGRHSWRSVGIGILAVAALLIIAAAVAYFALIRTLPDPSQARAKGRDQTTIVYDRSGRIITKLYADQDRTDVPIKSMPAYLRQAVVATEDQRFYQHRGVDPLGMARAVFVDVTSGTRKQGGSTITQQYVKNAFVTQDRTLKRKVSEAVLAYRLERHLSKDAILGLYLNTIYFGHSAYGVGTAAQTYFGKPVDKLTLAQSAMLAGVIKSPARYSPYRDMAAARGRRATVLAQMNAQGYITQAQQRAANAEPIHLVGLHGKAGAAPYFMEYVKDDLIQRFGPERVYRGGLRVRTTLDLPMQKAAERAVARALNRTSDPSAALVAIDPKTGRILALVGGRDFATQQFDVATQGHRQPGSAFKPFVLATALSSGVSPEATFDAGPKTLDIGAGKPWRVTGSAGHPGPMRLRQATEQSVNSVFAQLILRIGANKVARTAESMGVETPLTAVPAIALGGLKEGVTPLELTSAYGTLADGGLQKSPYALAEVRDATGKILYTAPGGDGKRVLDPAVAYLTTDLLRGVIARGTGTAAAIGRPAAGKTGTTQEYRDAWFVGYTPDLVAGVWVGFPNSQRAMTSVHGRAVTGGSFPAQIWASFMEGALARTKARDFSQPEGLKTAKICLETGLRATPFCPATGRGLFLTDNVPGLCTVHVQPTHIKVPKVVGMTKENALALLRQLMLQVKVVEKNVVGVPLGIVASQNPAVGSQGTTRTVVTIVVSKGSTSSSAPPVAKFSFSPADPSAGQAITFDGAASTDDGRIVKWVWEFGDGATGGGRAISHAYASAGNQEVTLWVTDDQDQVSSVTQTVAVR
jgi:penicillin-binding protein 1A